MQLAVKDVADRAKEKQEAVEAAEKEEEDEDDKKVQKSMTQMMGIFYMMYETEEKAGYTIFNEEGERVSRSRQTMPVRALALHLPSAV